MMALPSAVPTQAQEAHDIVARIRADPVWFLRHILGCKPYDKQEAMAGMVRDYRRVACVGGNSTGKDFLAGRLVLWWLCAYSPAKVIITGPTHRQVSGIVWKETRLAYYTARYPLGGRMLETPRWEVDDETFALGFSTDSPYTLQGWHSPHLLVVVTEAHAMRQEDMEALKRLNPERLLLVGNPLCDEGEFYNAFHGSGMYEPLSISALDTPNIREGREVIPGMVTVQDIEERKREWGEDNPLYVAGVLGQFPESLEDTLISRAWVDAAVKREGVIPGEPTVVALDVARYGSDRSVLVRRDGQVAHVVFSVQGKNLMELTGMVKAYLDDHPECHRRVTVDDVGVGGGVTDRLREMGYQVHAFNAGATAREPTRYFNAGAEAWGIMGAAFREGRVVLRHNIALEGQLCGRRYKVQSDRTIRLEGKEELRARGGKSPDEGDALAMTYAPGAGGGLQIWV